MRDLGLQFMVVKTDAEETNHPSDPEGTVTGNALRKLAACEKRNGEVLAADTIVWLDGKIYGKPVDLEEARAFLRELSGKTHKVYTGVAYWDGKATRTGVGVSEVTFKTLTETEIAEYVEKVKPTDRAGAYDIDDYGPLIIDHFEGEYENIMGLPVEVLRELGIGIPEKP